MSTKTRSLSLGLDSSTQSLTAVVVDIDAGDVLYQHSLDYAEDARLNSFGIDHREYIVPPREPGEADQPPKMYLASIDAMFSDLREAGIDLREVRIINDSGQQHGHVYLNKSSRKLFSELRKEGAGTGGAARDLPELLGNCFSYGTAPIWKTANTVAQSDAIREAVGGKGEMISLSGSDSPLRFTGAVIRRIGKQFPHLYEDTARIQLISSLISAVLAGNVDAPWDYGNGSGTSLMDYKNRRWSEVLVKAVSDGLSGEHQGLMAKLPNLAEPDSVVGTIARYFVERYGFDPECKIAAGSGDNPQSKVLVDGELLSLGTSFVYMVSTEVGAVDGRGLANAMYDGIGRSFMFGCRTNGAMVWSGVRHMHGLGKDEYKPADNTLSRTSLGGHLFIWQPDMESFPTSGVIEPVRVGYERMDLALDYAGAIESGLGFVYLFSRGFAPPRNEPVFVTGGVTKIDEIVRRVAAIWDRPVITLGTLGAALGAAVAGVRALGKAIGTKPDLDALSASVLPRSEPTEPRREDVLAFHGTEGYLTKLEAEYERLRS